MDYKNYTLNDLIQSYDYKLVAGLSNTDQLADFLVPFIQEVVKGKAIGINGSTCTGKSTFRNLLSEKLESNGLPIVRLEFDWFLHSRQKRANILEEISQHQITIEQVTENVWRVDKYIDTMRELKKSTPDINLVGLYNRELGDTSLSVSIRNSQDSYIIVDGVTVLDPMVRDFVDYPIRFDVIDDNILIERAIAREKLKPLTVQVSTEAIKRRFCVMELPHMQYMRWLCRDTNQFIVDVSDFNNLRIFSKY